MKKRKVDVDVDVDEEELYNDQIKLSKKTNDKEKKKIEKKFGLNLLRQGAECGWEGHELGRLALLINDISKIKQKKFVKFLLKSDVLSSNMIAGMQDHGYDFGSAAVILDMLFAKSKSRRVFMKSYSDALDNSLFSIRDSELVMKLSDITQRNNFSREEVLCLLRISCSHSETLKACGQILHSFCADMVESQALYYITEVMKFDFVLELFGLLDDFLNEMGDLRAVVDVPIRETLKINRLGEIVDSDADEDGNLRDFVVDDDTPERARGRCWRERSRQESVNDENIAGYSSINYVDDVEADESIASGDSDDEDKIYIHQREWSHSSESDDEFRDPMYRPYDDAVEGYSVNVSHTQNDNSESSSDDEKNCIQYAGFVNKRKRVITEDSEDSE